MEEVLFITPPYHRDVVATSCITSTYPDGLEIIESATAVGARAVMGGAYPSFMWRETLQDREAPVDYVVRGEGEETLVELLTVLRNGGDLGNVRGIARTASGWRRSERPPRAESAGSGPRAPLEDSGAPSRQLPSEETITPT